MRIFLVVLICLVSSCVYAEKVLISYCPDGKVYITYGQGDWVEKNAEIIVSKNDILKDLPYELIDSSQLPRNPDGTKKDRDYWTGKKGEGVRIDEDRKNADKLAKENKDKALKDKLKALGLTKEDLREAIK